MLKIEDIQKYDIDNLKKEDKDLVEFVEELKNVCLTDEVIQSYIEQKDVTGETMKKIYKDALKDFVLFLKEQMEYFKADIIIDKIEGYAEEECLCVAKK